jgi:hypothetical protein
MSKKKKMNHRSKASRKRQAETKGKTRFIPACNLDKVDTINEVVHSFRASDLGNASDPGLLSMSLAAYMGSIRNRLLADEHIKPNIFVQLGYSELSVNEWAETKQLHASGGFNLSLAEVVFANHDDIKQMVIAIEASVREILAQMNEESENTIKTVHIYADETDQKMDPRTSFGASPELMDTTRDGIMKKIVI